MTEQDHKPRGFGLVGFSEEDAVEDWRTLGREELLKRAILALDGAKMEAQEVGDEYYVRHVDAVLFPFLEAELEEAREPEEVVQYLTDEVGISEEAARLRLRDEDLWILEPDQRFDEDLMGEEGVRMWEEAAVVAHNIGNTINNGPGTIQANPAITQLVWDASTRAHEALRRARERAND